MSEVITVPFSCLILYYREIGIHRNRRWGFRDIFGFRTLQGLPFIKLADKVKHACEGRDVPSHEGWSAQREALKWFIDKGREGIYALEAKGIKIADKGREGIYAHESRGVKIKRLPSRSYYLIEGNHRALALYVLGDNEIRASVKH
jgi:hypothetical protein